MKISKKPCKLIALIIAGIVFLQTGLSESFIDTTEEIEQPKNYANITERNLSEKGESVHETINEKRWENFSFEDPLKNPDRNAQKPENETTENSTRVITKKVYETKTKTQSSWSVFQASISSNKVKYGDTVFIHGRIIGDQKRQIKVLKQNKTVIETEPINGSFNFSIEADQLGSNQIKAFAGDENTNLQLKVQPTLEIGEIKIPDNVQPGNVNPICTNVSSQQEAEISLYQDGELISNKTGHGEICFNTELSSGVNRLKLEGRTGDTEVNRTSVTVFAEPTESHSSGNQQNREKETSLLTGLFGLETGLESSFSTFIDYIEGLIGF